MNKQTIVYFLIILTAIFSISYGVQYFTLHPEQKNDIYLFMEVAKGNYNVDIGTAGWVYKDYLAIFFKPLLLFNETTAYILFSGVSTICFLILSHFTMRNKYGWILIIALLPIFKQALQSCTTSIALSLLLVNPYTALVAVLFKPHFVVFPILYTIFGYYRKNRSGTNLQTTQFVADNPDVYSFRKK